MDWSIILLAAAACITAGALWKLHQTKKEVYTFAEHVERALDDIISGNGIPETTEHAADSLWGRCSEKLWRINHIWTQKEDAGQKEKQMIMELISDISHQTKTPVANMKLYLEFLQDENLSEKGHEFLSHLSGQTEKLDFLLQSMVKMSRLETGTIHIKKEPGNLHETIAGAVGEIVPAAAKKNISLFVSCEETITARHDRKWTEESVFNILDNAVKYTAPGGRITVTVKQQEIFTKLSIQDTGKGIPLERQAEIFTRFYREPEVHNQSGIGIGLYLSRKILELQNGYIEVHSRPDAGAEFCLYLPNDEHSISSGLSQFRDS